MTEEILKRQIDSLQNARRALLAKGLKEDHPTVKALTREIETLVRHWILSSKP